MGFAIKKFTFKMASNDANSPVFRVDAFTGDVNLAIQRDVGGGCWT